MSSQEPMNRLLQGDVGSGKTIVAVQAVIAAIENGYQPHSWYQPRFLLSSTRETSGICSSTRPYRVELLTGSLRAKEKREVQAAIAEGEVDLVIGTHALIQEAVAFKKLGLTVIDEQHRFGVLQRAEIRRRGFQPRCACHDRYTDTEIARYDGLRRSRCLSNR
jgi:ATP-dependent DNA helicase RecG